MAYEVYFVVADADGTTSTITIPVPATVNLLNIPEIVADLGAMIVPMLYGDIISAGMRVEVSVSGFASGIAGTLADVAEKAKFVFRGVNGFLKSLSLPAVSEDIINTTGDVDLTDPNVAAFVTAMEDGWLLDDATTLVQPCDIRGDDLVTLVSAEEAFGRNRR